MLLPFPPFLRQIVELQKFTSKEICFCALLLRMTWNYSCLTVSPTIKLQVAAKNQRHLRIILCGKCSVHINWHYHDVVPYCLVLSQKSVQVLYCPLCPAGPELRGGLTVGRQPLTCTSPHVLLHSSVAGARGPLARQRGSSSNKFSPCTLGLTPTQRTRWEVLSA